MIIEKLIIDETEIVIHLAGYGCNSNKQGDKQQLKIKHKSNLKNTLEQLGVRLE